MKRRTFLRTTALGAPALGFPNLLRAKETAALPPHSEKLPILPFDGPPDSWTLVVLPDTQNIVDSCPEVFERQCEWIAAHRESHRICFVAHEGDITNNNSPEQWERARKAFDILRKAGVPFTLVPGNHDMGPAGHMTADRSTLLNDYFTAKDFAASSAHGLFEPGKLQNNWHHFDTPTGKFLCVGLEYGPRDVVADWAAQIVQKNADRRAILLTHCYLYRDSTRYDWSKFGSQQLWGPKAKQALVNDGGVNDGQDLWKKVIAPSKNVVLTLNGHVLHNGTGHLTSAATDGHTVHQLLANFQTAVQIDDGAGGVAFGGDPKAPRVHRHFGGGGFLRLMRFHPDGKRISVKSYSPWYDRFLTQPDQQFDLKLG